MIPVINPANVQEYLDFGLLGFALSRYSGCWIGFKAISETVESGASVWVDPERIKIIDGNGRIEDVAERVWRVVEPRV